MTNPDHTLHLEAHETQEHGAAKYLRRGRWMFWIFAIIGAWFLITEHKAHVVAALPFLILLACPLMHFFMHGGHGDRGGHDGGKE